MADMPRMYGSAEVARMLGVSHPLIRNLAAAGVAGFKVPGFRGWLFTDADVETLRNREDRRFKAGRAPDPELVADVA